MHKPLILLTLLACAGLLIHRHLSALSEENEALRADLMEAEQTGRDLALRGSDRSPVFVYAAGAHPQGPYGDRDRALKDAEALAVQFPGVPVHVLISESNVMAALPEPLWERS